jgi:hypothetical protein
VIGVRRAAAWLAAHHRAFRSFGTFAASDGDTLCFTAGIHDEADGLFGKLTAVAGRDR